MSDPWSLQRCILVGYFCRWHSLSRCPRESLLRMASPRYASVLWHWLANHWTEPKCIHMDRYGVQAGGASILEAMYFRNHIDLDSWFSPTETSTWASSATHDLLSFCYPMISQYQYKANNLLLIRSSCRHSTVTAPSCHRVRRLLLAIVHFTDLSSYRLKIWTTLPACALSEGCSASRMW
jgi:hypothetical protein